MEKFLRYKDRRDVTFVLGAGASKPDGVPLQRELLPMIIAGNIEEIEKSEIGRIVVEFIRDNFKCNEATNQFPQLEAVFGFIDYFIQQNESLNKKYTNERIIEIKEYLIKLIHYIVNLRTEQASNYYHKFWKAIERHSTNSSVITLNYDTLLEQTFGLMFKREVYIDYCIPLMNFLKVPELKNYNFWVNPREPINVNTDENPVSLKIIKLHGSLNWKYCNCCNQTLLTPWDRKIDLYRGKFLGYTYPDNQEYEYYCPLDGTDFQTLIMPPTFLKALQHPIISQLMSEASREIRASKKIVFVGYSLSAADVHIKALFQKHITPEKEVIVINPKQQEALELRYRSVHNATIFENCSFEELLENQKLIERIFY